MVSVPRREIEAVIDAFRKYAEGCYPGSAQWKLLIHRLRSWLPPPPLSLLEAAREVLRVQKPYRPLVQASEDTLVALERAVSRAEREGGA